MIIQGLEIDDQLLSQYELREIQRLLATCQCEPPSLEELWQMMDLVWQEIGCHQEDPLAENIGRFYEHPIWILNGIFSEQDIDSQHNRKEIVDWVIHQKSDIGKILDYGGGIGSLARYLAQTLPSLDISIYEPSPHNVAKNLAENHPNIQFVNDLSCEFDLVICLDVIEHLANPIDTLEKLILATRSGGYLIFGNCFFPVVQCHLPQTFHLRYTFGVFARLMGLRKVCNIHEKYIDVFEKTKPTPVNQQWIRAFEYISKRVYSPLNSLHMSYRRLKSG